MAKMHVTLSQFAKDGELRKITHSYDFKGRIGENALCETAIVNILQTKKRWSDAGRKCPISFSRPINVDVKATGISLSISKESAEAMDMDIAYTNWVKISGSSREAMNKFAVGFRTIVHDILAERAVVRKESDTQKVIDSFAPEAKLVEAN